MESSQLSFFPSPYPGEWWYSVLCRYHVRTGNGKHATTLHQLYGSRPMVHGRLIPGGDIAAVLSRLPEGILDTQGVLQEHTLLPYYLRFYGAQRKQQILESLLQGKCSGITSIRTQMPDGREGLKYCPLCYTDDLGLQGEPYWHREHQIPLMPICPRHRCPLEVVETKFSRLSEMFLPLSVVKHKDKSDTLLSPWMEPLTEMLAGLLEMPYDVGPPTEYNNIYTTLLDKGLGMDKIQSNQPLSAPKIKSAIREFYGQDIAESYFAKLSPAVLSRMVHWTLTSPDRYALLAVLAGLSVDRVMGGQKEGTNELLIKLMACKNSGIVYPKHQLASLLGLQPHQLDSLVKTYGIDPFWKDRLTGDQRRDRSLRIKLSDAEQTLLKQAAEISGNAQLAVFARTLLLLEANKILEGENKS